VNDLVISTLLRYRCLAAAHILTYWVHLAWLSGLNRALIINVRFGLMISGSGFEFKTHLQFRVAGRLHFDKGLQFCFMAECSIDSLF